MNRKRILSFLKVASVVSLPISLAACNGTSSSTATTTSQSTSLSTTTNPSTTSSNNSASNATSVLSLSRLTSIKNYSFTQVVGNGGASLTMVGLIHSPTNFEISLGSTHTIFVGGQAYEVLGPLAPQKISIGPNYFQQQGIIEAANEFVDFTKAHGVTVEKTGTCTVANIPGTTYTEASPSNVTILKIEQVACISNSNGALLSIVQQASGTASPTGNGQRFNFQITGVNNVAPIALP